LVVEYKARAKSHTGQAHNKEQDDNRKEGIYAKDSYDRFNTHLMLLYFVFNKTRRDKRAHARRKTSEVLGRGVGIWRE
jgi:hypothetical protein